MYCILWKILVVSTENKFLFEDSFNVLFVRIIFLWFFMVFIMAYLWKGFSCGFYDFLHAIFVVMVFVVFSNNPLWFLWFLWFLWSSTFYSCLDGYWWFYIIPNGYIVETATDPLWPPSPTPLSFSSLEASVNHHTDDAVKVGTLWINCKFVDVFYSCCVSVAWNWHKLSGLSV